MDSSNKKNDSSVRYRLLAQYRNNTIRVEDMANQTSFITTAQQVACDPCAVSLFTSHDACIIGYIAGLFLGSNGNK